MVRAKGGSAQPRTYYHKESAANKIVDFLSSSNNTRQIEKNKREIFFIMIDNYQKEIEELLKLIKQKLKDLKELRNGRV